MSNTEIETALEAVKSAVFCQTTEESQSYYDVWSKRYDSDTSTLGSLSTIKITEMFSKHVTDLSNCQVLDLGGGTGRVSYNLRNRIHLKGDIDILDANMNMLYEANQKDINFRNILRHFVTENGNLPMSDEMYDVVVSSGTFLPNHIPVTSIFGIINVIKRGGLLLITRRLKTTEGYGHQFVENVEKLCSEKKLKYVDHMEYVHFTKVEDKFPSVCFVYQRL
uniref:uncharacterized protein LOC101243204 n=1 Tax=Ciona intestinalis TaxID=7719 RepID=UPI0002B8DA20|nr:uncharacterized protein LOC101243204 [Ciona intestinalis]|eukprot:XP_004227099.1 uncharacterized protein LOC101243204 [Ciona intestinalis]